MALYIKTNVHSWMKRDQLYVTRFIISLSNGQHVSDVNTSILRSLWLICWVISWVVLLWYDVCWSYVVVRLGWCGIRMQAEALVLQPASEYHRDRIPVGTRFSARPDRPWGPPGLLYNGYPVFPGGKLRPGRAADHSPPSSAAVVEE